MGESPRDGNRTAIPIDPLQRYWRLERARAVPARSNREVGTLILSRVHALQAEMRREGRVVGSLVPESEQVLLVCIPYEENRPHGLWRVQLPPAI